MLLKLGLNWIKTGTSRPSNTSYTVDGLMNNTQYHFRVFAENSIGQSLPLETELAVLAKPPYSKFFYYFFKDYQ